MIVYLIRHSHYHNPLHIFPGRLPVSLSEKGLKQAHRIKNFLADKQIDKIFSSAVWRCQQTSKIIAAEKIPIQFDPRLLEVLSAYQGYWGQAIENNQIPYYAFVSELGGETFEQVQDRMWQFWQELLTLPLNQVVICSHGDPLYALYVKLIHKSFNRLTEFSPTDYQDIASVRIIETNHNHVQINQTLNFTD